MFSNITGQKGTIVDDGTIPDTTGSVTIQPSAAVANKQYVTLSADSNNLVIGRDYWGDYQMPSYSTTIPVNYNLMERHKTYKIIHSIMSEYRKNKTQYRINVRDSYSYCGSNSITIKPGSLINICFSNDITGREESISKISEHAGPILEQCITKFLDKHAEEFMELIESETKKDVIEFAKKEEKSIKESLEFVEMIKDMED